MANINIGLSSDQVPSCVKVSEIYKKWVELRKKSGAKRTPRLTPKRQKEIAAALRSYGIDNIVKVLDFLLTEDSYAVWMRENKYTQFENIFRKFQDKLKRAEEYFDKLPPKEEKMDFFIPFSIVDGDE